MPSEGESIQLEIEAVERFELFQRSPIQLKLLKYLGRRAADPSVGAPTQYDIAIEAFGRHEGFDQSEDSSVRVQVSRLRRNLEAYYAVNQPVEGGCLYIPAGSYRLKSASLAIAYPKLSQQVAHLTSIADTEPDENRRSRHGLAQRIESFMPFATRREIFALGATAAFATLAITGYSLFPSPANKPDVAQTGLEKPSVSFSVDSIGYAGSESSNARIEGVVESEVQQRISRAIIAEPTKLDGDFHVAAKIDTYSSGQRNLVLEVTRKGGSVFYHDEIDLPEDPDHARAVVGWRLAKLVSPPGLISRALVAEIPAQPRNSFECFIVVELGRNSTGSSKSPLELCKEGFPEGEFYPYLAARDLFLKFQSEMIARGDISERGENWQQMGSLLRTYPDNPYVNTVAAKALYSKNECAAAKEFEETALLRGHDYPALELALVVEAYACLEGELDDARYAERIREIVEAQDSPHPLLEVYALTAIALSNQRMLVDTLGDQPFGYGEETPTVNLIADLRQLLADEGHVVANPKTFNALVWNPRSRQKVLKTKT